VRSGRLLAILAALVAAGTAGRVPMAFATYGVQYDIDSARIVADALRTPGLGPYDTGRWPYPPGSFPLIWGADALARATGLPFHAVVQLPAIAADAAIAVIVCWFLLGRGAGERAALTGAALVALGPSFAVISGYHGQIDSVAILPAVAGAVVWSGGARHRAPLAGALIGLGAAIKTVPLFTAFALLGSARGRREAGVLLIAAVAVPLAAVLPWLVLDPPGTVSALTANHGVPGFAGVSALLQPGLTRYWSGLDSAAPAVTPAVLALTDVQNLLVGIAVIAVAALTVRRRTEPLEALVAMWLTVLAVNPNFAYQYVVWALPFLLLAGRLRETAAIQALLLPPAVLLYSHADKGGWVYWAFAEIAWLGILVLWAAALLRITGWRGRPLAAPSTTRR